MFRSITRQTTAPRALAAAIGALLLLAGCVPSTAPETPAARPRAPVLNRQGLEGVLGHDARALEAQFGRPNLDVQEGDARKYQFASEICVLDVYLYPPARGREPVATWVDARLPDGRDIDRASCVAALISRQQGR
ncbi:hypothetical protein [Sphingomonas sp.]|uniref:hypothetical protein n=1 Tax=Sphingomonas sp. TaxID=28214 RepID=UPI002FCC9CFB